MVATTPGAIHHPSIHHPSTGSSFSKKPLTRLCRSNTPGLELHAVAAYAAMETVNYIPDLT